MITGLIVKQAKENPWLWISLELSFFILVFVALEYLNYRRKHKFVPFEVPQNYMTSEEFESLIQQGRNLVILNELVLDVSDWLGRHPGGLWVLKHNIGKDISKFFYGGYSQDGNRDGVPSNPGHTHSNFAREAVNKVVIARYCKTLKSSAVCRIKTQPETVNSLTKNFTFTVVDPDNKPQDFRLFFPGLTSLGKNFLVYNIPNAREAIITRQYSICYSMNDAICNNIIQCLNENSKTKFNKSLFNQ